MVSSAPIVGERRVRRQVGDLPRSRHTIWMCIRNWLLEAMGSLQHCLTGSAYYGEEMSRGRNGPPIMASGSITSNSRLHFKHFTD